VSRTGTALLGLSGTMEDDRDVWRVCELHTLPIVWYT
jgi:hypothetical protein